MGPILAGTFGAVIRDKPLRNIGIKAEILGLFLCVAIGFVFGLLSEAINSVYVGREWPTPEMISRGQERSLWIGLLIALPSGAGVALSVLAGNAGCLVGVAISASLLPPAVNAGLLWGMATIRTFRAQEEQLQFIRVDGILKLMKTSLMPFPGYQVNYYEEMDKECAMLGLVSLGLALVNIFCIVLAALVVLKIKEVAPKTSVARTSRFWKEDIKIARDYNTTMPPSEAEDLGQQFLAEWATLNGLEPDELMSDDAEAERTRIETLKDIMQDVETDDVFQAVSHSVPNCGDTRPLSKRVSAIAPLHRTVVHIVPEKESRVSVIKSWFRSSLSPVTANGDPDPDLHPDLRDVELRRPQRQVALPPRPPSNRNSVAVLRHSLMNSDSPYTLWPSVEPDTGNISRPRFVVSPVPEEPEEVAPQCIVRQRVSRFLQDPCVVVKETTC